MKNYLYMYLLFNTSIKVFILNWSIADYQCCDSFRYTTKGLSHMCTCIHSPKNSPSLQAHIAFSSIPCAWLSILNILLLSLFIYLLFKSSKLRALWCILLMILSHQQSFIIGINKYSKYSKFQSLPLDCSSSASTGKAHYWGHRQPLSSSRAI